MCHSCSIRKGNGFLRVTPTVTRGLGFRSLKRRTAPVRDFRDQLKPSPFIFYSLQSRDIKKLLDNGILYALLEPGRQNFN